MEKIEIIEKIFPEKLSIPIEIEKEYPPRKLSDGAMVTRIAPSPTGFIHIGVIYAALISERLAHQSNGIFYLRIEDTDKKREIENASNLIVSSLVNYNIMSDEGYISDEIELGKYGPYKQSERANIYKSYIKILIESDLAYPCFCTHEELDEIRKLQESQDVKPGYYGKWAKWRHKSDQEILDSLNAHKPFVVRFKSNGNINKKIKFKDKIKGSIDLPENDQDIVIMKSNGLPTYHLAHVVDDHLMGTTHVLRGDEWLSSISLHIQLFSALGWKSPHYGHISPIQKIDGQSKRKLSKRKDPEAGVSYYNEQGYPKDAIIEYLLNIANSNFEDWRRSNPKKDNKEFILQLSKLSNSGGALFDIIKLNNISKNIIAYYSTSAIYKKSLKWANQYDIELYKLMNEYPDYIKKILGIERSGASKVRKDIGKWSDIKTEIKYFFDHKFLLTIDDAMNILTDVKLNALKLIIDSFIELYNEQDDCDKWFGKMKQVAREHGYAENVKEYKNNPKKYKGNIADVAKIFRVLLTGKTNTPDLYTIMKVMGKERVLKRLSLVNKI